MCKVPTYRAYYLIVKIRTLVPGKLMIFVTCEKHTDDSSDGTHKLSHVFRYISRKTCSAH